MIQRQLNISEMVDKEKYTRKEIVEMVNRRYGRLRTGSEAKKSG